jgi:hypothetical protein
MRKIIDEDGNNAWLCNGTPHCFVRRDFIDTYDGIKPCRSVNPTGSIDLTSTTTTVPVEESMDF